MAKSLMFSAVLAGCLFIAASSRGEIAPVVEPAATAQSADAMPEPITGTPAQTAPGSESPTLDPFKPYAIGPARGDKSPKPFWSYSDLSPAERSQVDRGRDVSNWAQTHETFAKATAERAHQAAASSAAAQLGASHLAIVGVVP